MRMKPLALSTSALLFAVVAVSAFHFLRADEPTVRTKDDFSLHGSYMIHLSTGPTDVKAISDATLCNIGGHAFLKCTMTSDPDVLKEEYRGTTCYVAIDSIVAIQQQPARQGE